MLRRQMLGALCASCAAASVPGVALAVPTPNDELGKGRYARLHVFLEKTVLQIDVLDLTVRVDQPTADALEGALKGRKYSKELEATAVRITIDSSNAFTGLQFKRDFDLDEFVEGIRAETRRAYMGSLIDRSEYARVYEQMPRWFSFLAKRGVKKGDWLYNRGRPSGLYTLYNDEKGQKLWDITIAGSAPTRTLLATYLAPGGDLREPLVRSLFGGSS